jgi:hypothetical protein
MPTTCGWFPIDVGGNHPHRHIVGSIGTVIVLSTDTIQPNAIDRFTSRPPDSTTPIGRVHQPVDSCLGVSHLNAERQPGTDRAHARGHGVAARPLHRSAGPHRFRSFRCGSVGRLVRIT